VDYTTYEGKRRKTWVFNMRLDYYEAVYNQRVETFILCHIHHGTTRKIPQEEFTLAKVGIRKVYHDCHIYVDYNYYIKYPSLM